LTQLSTVSSLMVVTRSWLVRLVIVWSDCGTNDIANLSRSLSVSLFVCLCVCVQGFQPNVAICNPDHCVSEIFTYLLIRPHVKSVHGLGISVYKYELT